MIRCLPPAIILTLILRRAGKIRFVIMPQTEIYFYNTLSNRRERFHPQNAERLTMYVCGPTVYGPVHLGNGRPAVVFDVLFRLLRCVYGKDAVVYARNITDIDDKIIAAAAANNESTIALTARWRDDYHRQMAALNVLPPTVEPYATEHLAEMVEMIHRLLDAGYAYEATGHVLFHVPSFVGYGALSNRRRDEMLAGARVEVAPYKKDAADFVLWKPAAAEEPGWDSPWGRGRPGWHLECSAMAGKHLGECLDIHGGGQDLIFPHHENEIAQSCCASGGDTFARYWLHNGHLTMAGEKMSKSIGNVRLLGEVLRQFPGEVVRYALLSTHYRKPLTWTERLLGDSRSALDRLYRALGDEADGEIMEDEEIDEFFAGALADDINAPLALSRLHDMAGEIQRLGNADTKILRRRLKSAGGLLGFFNQSAEAWFHTAAAAQIAADENSASLSQQEIEAKIAERQKARAQRDFNLADKVRDELLAAGVVLEDSPSGTGWRRK